MGTGRVIFVGGIPICLASSPGTVLHGAMTVGSRGYSTRPSISSSSFGYLLLSMNSSMRMEFRPFGPGNAIRIPLFPFHTNRQWDHVGIALDAMTLMDVFVCDRSAAGE